MSCEIGQNIIICGPPKSVPVGRHVGHCPMCGRGRRMVTRFDGIYYGTTTYCLACNGREQDGDWRARVGRYAAEDRTYIKGLWDTGVPLRKFRALVVQYQRDYWADEETP